MTTDKPKPRPTLDAQTVQAIRAMKAQGEKQQAIAVRFGISAAAVSLIVRGLRHREAS